MMTKTIIFALLLCFCILPIYAEEGSVFVDDEGEVYMLEGEYYRPVSSYTIHVNDPFSNCISGVDFFCEVCYTTQISQYSDPFNCTARLEGATNSSGALTLILLRKAYFGDEEPPEPSGGVLSTENLAQQGVGVLIIDEPGGQEQAAGWPQYNFVSQQVFLENVPNGYTNIGPVTAYTTHSLWTSNFLLFNENDDADNNGVYDDFESELVKKFCPSLKLHSLSNDVSPEPVAIMFDEQPFDAGPFLVNKSIWITIYSIAGNYIGTFPAYHFGYSNGSSDLNIFGRWYPEHFRSDILADGTNQIEENKAIKITLLQQISVDQNGCYILDENNGLIVTDLFTNIVFLHTEFAGHSGNTPSSWENAYSQERIDNTFKDTIYGHIFTENNQVVIQYWFFYPYNDFANNHEGDWEHINVILNSQMPETAEIVKVEFFFHHKVHTRDFPDFEYEDNEGIHPMVYVGGSHPWFNGTTSGGSYPETGLWDNVGSVFDEHVYGNGRLIDYSTLISNNQWNSKRGLVLLKNPEFYNYDNYPELSWLNVDFLVWGHIDVDSPENFIPILDNSFPPVGPAANPGWNDAGANELFEIYSDRP